jgi:DNA-binding MarR family transcriptional regulator
VEETGPPEDAWSEFVVAVFRMNGLIMAAGESIARPIGQSSARWQVLGRAFEPQTVAKMARDMGHAPQSVQRIADVLAGEGLVAYSPHPTDRRTKLLALTPSGLDVLTAIYHRQLDWSQRVTSRLDPGQLAEITQELVKIGDTVATEIDPTTGSHGDDQRG